MAKPRRVSALSSVLKETQQYNKVAQEDEQVLSPPVEQEPVNTEKQISGERDQPAVPSTEIQKSVSADNHLSVSTGIQRPVDTEIQRPVNAEIQQAMMGPRDTEVPKSVSAETQQSVNTSLQKNRNAELSERTHKQTIVISEDLALRLKVHAAKRKETIAHIATRAFEKLLAEEESI